jgi:glycosidase
MPDRFATGTTDEQKEQMYKGMKQNTWSSADMARHGGDLAGMTQHLDYLQDLGVTAIWHTPTLENDMPEQSYHGYAITNYYRTDPRIGSNEDYRNWVDECHKRGIKVIKDIVFNHCGSENFLFRDRPADDWFTYNSIYTPTTYKTGMPGDPNSSKLDFDLTVDGWFTMAMPDFNGRNPLVADYLIQTSIWWIEYAGIDGIRQDTYPYNDFDFMRRWCMDVEREYPGFNIVGETWINNPVAVSYWQKDSPLAAPKNSELKTVMDFPMMYMLNSCVDEETDTWDHGFARLCDLLGQDRVYATPNSVFTFLANHDTNRFQPTEEKAKDITRYKQALALLLTLRGIPQLYYGDEIGMYANKSVNDGALRQNFPGGWPGDKNNAFSAEGRTELQAQYHNYTRRLLNWRKGASAIHT